MITDVALLVLRCADLPASKAFYEALGLTFRLEKHGRGPEHWSCQIGSLVLELYPTSTAPTSTERLGFHVVDVQAAVTAAVAAGGRLEGPALVVDPDGRKVELSVAPVQDTGDDTNRALKVFELDRACFDTLEEFYAEVSRCLIPDSDWGHNLDAFNDILRGGSARPKQASASCGRTIGARENAWGTKRPSDNSS
jgi:catechol 2,3-dioxygenase-like lactoylglutathione lyase family enzyme